MTTERIAAQDACIQSMANANNKAMRRVKREQQIGNLTEAFEVLCKMVQRIDIGHRVSSESVVMMEAREIIDKVKGTR
jgi:hypothetical protein